MGDVAVGAGVAYEGGDARVQDGGALVEGVEELVGEGEFVVGAYRVGEGGDQGEEGLGDGPLAPGVVLFGFGAGGFEGGDGAVDVAVGEVDVGQDAVVAAFPAQGGDGGEGGGEVAADAREVGKSSAGARGAPVISNATISACASTDSRGLCSCGDNGMARTSSAISHASGSRQASSRRTTALWARPTTTAPPAPAARRRALSSRSTPAAPQNVTRLRSSTTRPGRSTARYR
nr:hypothetical protein [Streptomyces rimosus]